MSGSATWARRLIRFPPALLFVGPFERRSIGPFSLADRVLLSYASFGGPMLRIEPVAIAGAGELVDRGDSEPEPSPELGAAFRQFSLWARLEHELGRGVRVGEETKEFGVDESRFGKSTLDTQVSPPHDEQQHQACQAQQTEPQDQAHHAVP